MSIGEPTERVLQVLEGARLFIDVERVRKDVDTLRAAIEAHAWPKMWADWKRDNALPKEPHAEAAMLERWMAEHPALLRKAETAREAHGLIQKKFVKNNRTLKKEYGSLLGRLKSVESVLNQIKDAGPMIEVKTGYEKVRNRRFQARHFWPTEASAKKGVEQEAGTAGFELWGDFEEPFIATTSPRGRWFVAKAYDHRELDSGGIYVREWRDEKTGEGWWDEFTGPTRPLVGVDMSASMYQIVAVVTGDGEAEQYLRDTDLKPALFAGLREVDHHGFLQQLSDTQARASMGVVQNIAYGQRDLSILKKLKSDTEEYGSWRDVSLNNFQHMLKEAGKISKAVELVLAMCDRYLTTARALAEAALARDPKIGIRLLDPFDGHPYILNRPITVTITLPNAATPLAALVPVGDGPNWYGRLVPASVRKNGKWVDAVKKDGTPKMRRVDTKGSIYTSLAPVMVHALDAAYAAHVILKLREFGVRDFAVVHDCFLVPSDAYPLLMNALEEAARPWFEGLEPFYKTFEEYLPGNPVVALWRSRWEARRAAGNDWPAFKFKQETTVDLKFDDSVKGGEST
jgi:hypothetical protein